MERSYGSFSRSLTLPFAVDPDKAYAAHAHHASYLEILQVDHQWNPSDYAIHLSRRARGLPFCCSFHRSLGPIAA